MNKLLLAALMLLTFTAKPQAVFEVKDLDNSNAMISNNQVINKSTTAGGIDISHHVEIKNISANTITISVRKYEDLIHTVSGTDMAEAFFCFNTFCYVSSVTSATTELTAGASFSFIPKLNEASTMGESHIKYKISDGTNDHFVIFKYNAPVGVKEIVSHISRASGVYPNPATTISFIDIFVNNDVATSVKIYNSLGSVVSNKQIALSKGKNTIPLDCESLEAGIYFVAIGNGHSRITKKLTISK